MKAGRKCKELKRLRNFLSQDGKDLIDVSLYFGYATPSAISNWFYRNSIPAFQKKRLEEFLDKRGV